MSKSNGPQANRHSRVGFLIDVDVIRLGESQDSIINGKAKLINGTRIEILSLKRLESTVWLRFPVEATKFYEALVDITTDTTVTVTESTSLYLVEVNVIRAVDAAGFVSQVIGNLQGSDSVRQPIGTLNLRRVRTSVA